MCHKALVSNIAVLSHEQTTHRSQSDIIGLVQDCSISSVLANSNGDPAVLH